MCRVNKAGVLLRDFFSALGIDVILGGHSHVFMKTPELMENARGRKVLVSQAGEKGVLIGRVDIVFSSK